MKNLSLSKALVILLVGVVFVIYTSPLIGFSIYFAAAFMVCCVLFYFWTVLDGKVDLKIFCFFVASMVFGLTYALVRVDVSPVIFVTYTMLSFVSAYILAGSSSDVSRFSLFSFFYLTLWFSCLALMNGVTQGATNEYLYGASRNYITHLFLMACSLYYGSKISGGMKYSVLPVLVMTVVSVIVGGRSGIAVSILLLIVVILDVFRASKGFRFYHYVAVSFSVLALSILFISYMNEIVSLILMAFDSTKYQDKGLESLRWAINKEYVGGLDFRGLIWGGRLEDLDLINSVGGNPHNSIIDGHASLGLAFVVFFIFLVFYPILNLLSSFSGKRLAVYAIFLIVLARGFVDAAFFYGVFDFVVFYLFILASFPRKSEKIRCRQELARISHGKVA